MNSLQTTLTLNNRAVELFHSDRIPEAAKAYYQSLNIVKDLMRSSSAQQDDATSNDTTLPQQERFHSCMKTPISMKDNAKLFVYQNPLILKEWASSSQNLLQAMEIYCAAILFNAAILHHQDSIKNGNSSSMDKAHRLYKASRHLLRVLPDLFENDTVTLLRAANMNNLAQIEVEKGMVFEASERLWFLSHLIGISRTAIGRVFTMDELGGMLSNTLMRHGLISSPAA